MIAHRSLFLLAALSVPLASQTALAACGCGSGCGQSCSGAACGQGCPQASCGSCAPTMVQQTVMTPEYVTETRKVKVVECSCETRERTFAVCQLVPETKTINVNYTVMVPETRHANRDLLRFRSRRADGHARIRGAGPNVPRGRSAVHRLRAGMEGCCPAVHCNDAALRDASGHAANDPLRSDGGNVQRHRGSRTLGNRLRRRVLGRVRGGVRQRLRRLRMRLATMGPQLRPRAGPTDRDEAGML